MARQGLIQQNEKRQRLVRRYAAKRQHLKAIIHDRKLPAEERFQAAQALQKIPRNASPVRVRNRCAMTGRSRGYHRRFGVSRIALREMASSGQLPGVVKASW